MKRANSRNASQDGAPTDAPSQLADKCSRIVSRLAGTEERRPVNLARHQTRCRICRHPNREAIEHDYLDWRSPSQIGLPPVTCPLPPVPGPLSPVPLPVSPASFDRNTREVEDGQPHENKEPGHFLIATNRMYLKKRRNPVRVAPGCSPEVTGCGSCLETGPERVIMRGFLNLGMHVRTYRVPIFAGER